MQKVHDSKPVSKGNALIGLSEATLFGSCSIDFTSSPISVGPFADSGCGLVQFFLPKVHGLAISQQPRAVAYRCSFLSQRSRPTPGRVGLPGRTLTTPEGEMPKKKPKKSSSFSSRTYPTHKRKVPRSQTRRCRLSSFVNPLPLPPRPLAAFAP